MTLEILQLVKYGEDCTNLLYYILQITYREKTMQAITFNEMMGNFSILMDKVNDDHEPLIVTREHQKPVVMMSLDDFNAWQETDYLTRSVANAKDLSQAVEDIREHKNLVRKQLIDL